MKLEYYKVGICGAEQLASTDCFDKTGKEIIEGDVVEYVSRDDWTDEEEYVGQRIVLFKKGSFGLFCTVSSFKTDFVGVRLGKIQSRCLKVIGNAVLDPFKFVELCK